MSRLSCVHVHNLMRSCSDLRAFMFRLSCNHVQYFVHSSDFRAFMLRLSCFHVQTFVRSPDGRSFMFVRFSMFPGYVTLNSQRPTPPPLSLSSCLAPRPHFWSGHTCFRLRPQPGHRFLVGKKFPSALMMHDFHSSRLRQKKTSGQGFEPLAYCMATTFHATDPSFTYFNDFFCKFKADSIDVENN